MSGGPIGQQGVGSQGMGIGGMGGGMQQQLPPQMQPQMAALQQQLLSQQGGMQQPLAAMQGRQMPPPGYVNDLAYLDGMQSPMGGMPIRAPNGNFGVPGGMGGGLPAQGGGPMGLTQQQIVDQIRLATQNGMMPQGDTFIPNQSGQSFGNMLSGLSPEFRAGLLNPRPPVGALPNPQYVDPNTGRYTGLALPIGPQPITPGPMRSTPTPARPLPPRPGPQVQPIRRPLPMTGLGGLAGLAGMFRGRQ